MPLAIDKRVYHFHLIGNVPTEIIASNHFKTKHILQQRIYRFGKRNSKLNFKQLSIVCVCVWLQWNVCFKFLYWVSSLLVFSKYAWVRVCTNKDKVNTHTAIKEPDAGRWHKTVKSNSVERPTNIIIINNNKSLHTILDFGILHFKFSHKK